VTIASRPSVGQDGESKQVIWVRREWKYFKKRGWTGASMICPSGAISTPTRDGFCAPSQLSARSLDACCRAIVKTARYALLPPGMSAKTCHGMRQVGWTRQLSMGVNRRDHVSGRYSEVPALIKFHQRDLPGFATVISVLREFEPKIVFSWHLSVHLSVLIGCVQVVEDRLPSADEQNLLYEFEHKLDPLIKANGNGLFLARVTHDAFREIIWRVHNPEAANSALHGILHARDYPREFDYRIDEDRRRKQSAGGFRDAKSTKCTVTVIVNEPAAELKRWMSLP
jgi:hypothetical protein